ncbi:MAG: hypothetical protein ACE5EC_09015 [Phycisphaerae bacterium]
MGDDRVTFVLRPSGAGLQVCVLIHEFRLGFAVAPLVATALHPYGVE